MDKKDIIFLTFVYGGIASYVLAPLFLLLAIVGFFRKNKSSGWSKAYKIFLICAIFFSIYAFYFNSFIHELQK